VKIDVADNSVVSKQIQVHIPWDELEPVYQDKLKTIRKKIQLPGFRRGKVPMALVRERYRDDVLMDVLDEMIAKAYRQALEENDWNPLDQGRVTQVEPLAEGSPMEFKIELEVEPPVQLPNYKKGFSLTKVVVTPTEEDVDKALETIREQFATAEPHPEGAEDGDFLQVDIQKLDETGLPIIGSRLENRLIKIGEGVFGGEVAERLKGVKPGESVTIQIPDPDNSGQKMSLALDVKRVEAQRLPELNDDFAKLVNPELSGLEELKQQVKEDIQRQLDRDAERTFERQIADYLVQKSKLELPPRLLEKMLDRAVEDERKHAHENFDEEEVRERIKPLVIWEIKWYLIQRAIEKNEKLEVSTKELRERRRRIQRSLGGSKRTWSAKEEADLEDELRSVMLREKIFEHLKQFVKVKEKRISSKELGGK